MRHSRMYRVWYKSGFSKHQLSVLATTAAEAKQKAESLLGVTVSMVWLISK